MDNIGHISEGGDVQQPMQQDTTVQEPSGGGSDGGSGGDESTRAASASKESEKNEGYIDKGKPSPIDMQSDLIRTPSRIIMTHNQHCYTPSTHCHQRHFPLYPFSFTILTQHQALALSNNTASTLATRALNLELMNRLKLPSAWTVMTQRWRYLSTPLNVTQIAPHV